ncbi:MerR family DNA-binding transcriptional regulator [Desulfosporosinus lacus]|uniref:MerR family regulatory protein n=1 Tax=Desulfosporosinus lacus DSM 15449 TaxID=1121420 RepID=A0A1M5ZD12_9FIRM|nr:MerR family regulatory protein [Desulfosporosinus lacus DSM 15449]
MNTYKTAEIAHRIGIHPNTVRLYEEVGLIPKPQREANGYRVFTDFHMEQFKFARTALKAASLDLRIDSVLLPVIVMIALAVTCIGVSIRFFRWE